MRGTYLKDRQLVLPYPLRSVGHSEISGWIDDCAARDQNADTWKCAFDVERKTMHRLPTLIEHPHHEESRVSFQA